MANKELTSITAGGETYDITDSKAIKTPKICYATCATAAGTAAKVVTTSTNSGFKLEVGVVVAIKFSNSNTASNVTLNVDSAGAKSIYYNNAVYTSNSNGICGYKNRVVLYMYDGTYWVWIGYSNDNNTTYSNRAAEEGGTATSLCTTGEKFIWNNNSRIPVLNIAEQNLYDKIKQIFDSGNICVLKDTNDKDDNESYYIPSEYLPTVSRYRFVWSDGSKSIAKLITSSGITSINYNNTVSQIDITNYITPATGVTLSHFKALKYGDVVCITGQVTVSSSLISADQNPMVLTINTIYAPAGNVTNSIASYGELKELRIHSTGSVQFVGPRANVPYVINITYITN